MENRAVSTQSPATRVALTTLQLGMGWLPEQPGGLNRVFYNLAHYLPEAGVGVRGIVAAMEGGGVVEGFAPIDTAMPQRLLAARRAIRRGLASGPDLVASHFALYTAPGLDLLRDVPLVVHFHGPWAAESGVEGNVGVAVRAKRAIEQAVYRRAERFIVLSEAFRDVLVQRYEADPERIRLVPGGVEVERFDTGLSRLQARQQLGWSTDRPIVICVRRLRHRMGLEDLIEATVRLRERIPDVLVLIAGTGPIEAELDAQIETRGLRQHVRLLGFVPDEDLPVAYRAANLSVVPTVALEGFGLIVAESLAAGTPPLVTPVGGLPEVVRDLSTNLILPAHGPDALVEGLGQALDGTLALPSEEACQAFARTRYDWAAVARQTRAVYEEVLG
ncbi:MAG: glycosyltransferase family 4 protein [Rhodothermaceae bacterium]|nr:glycosyltransferase family 4 protein [Rhodothermaceae bacterium]